MPGEKEEKNIKSCARMMDEAMQSHKEIVVGAESSVPLHQDLQLC